LRTKLSEFGPNARDWPKGWAEEIAEHTGRSKNSVQVLRSRMARHWPNITGPDPDDEAFRDRGVKEYIQPYMVWALALITTYGLRPSEAWHAEGINEKGWLVIPGDGKTKTARHIAPPVPADWLDRYQLKENFHKHQAMLNRRWPIRWEDRDGLLIPVNNTQVSQSLYKRFGTEEIPFLVPADKEYGGEWVRPYDLRHSYAIRCFKRPELKKTADEEKARWMGHSLDMHNRVYLRFMSDSDRDAAVMARFESGDAEAPQQENPTVVVELPDDVLAKLAKLEQLEKILGS